MSSKLIPANPSEVMVIRDITPNIVTLSVPFSRAGLFKIGGRGTIIRLQPSGTLAVVSPVALTPEAKAKLSEMGGTVGYIIAPDFEHHIFISDWAKEYPEAKIIGPEGLPEKRIKASPHDPKIGKEKFAFVYNSSNSQDNNIDPEFSQNFEVEYMRSHPNKEIVLFYKPDKVLIEADLLFNLPAVEQYSKVPAAQRKLGFADKFFESFQTTEGDAKGTKRMLWYVFSAKDRKAWNGSIQRINTWDFETIVPCHGETIVGNGKAVFEKIFEWHIRGHK